MRVLSLIAFCAAVCAALPAAPAFSGYIVTAQWDGRTAPVTEWALDVTRQDTEYRVKQEVKLQQLIPTTVGPALSPTFTAYDEATRTYFTTVRRNSTSGSLWGLRIADDVESASWYSNETRYRFPVDDAVLVGLEAVSSPSGAVTVSAFFSGGQVVQIDPRTGATRTVAMIGSNSREISSAITSVGTTLYAITQNINGAPDRAVVSLNGTTGQVLGTANLQDLKGFNNLLEAPFEMRFIPHLQTLVVFFTGNFDHIIFVEPHSGMTSFFVEDLSQFSGDEGNFEFTANDRLEDDDFWADSAYDATTQRLYFQCTDVNPDDDDQTTALCFTEVKELKKADWVNSAIEPMTYGYAGMQYVQVKQ